MKIQKLSYKPVQNIDVSTIIVEESDLWPTIEPALEREDLYFKLEGRDFILIRFPGEEFARGHAVEGMTEEEFAFYMYQALEVLQKRRRGDLPLKD